VTEREYVYFVQADRGGPVKIGTAYEKRLEARLVELQCGNPNRLVCRLLVDGGRNLESSMHAMFRNLRIRGEWFECVGALRSFLEERGCELPEADADAKPASREVAYDEGFDAGMRLAHARATANFSDALEKISGALNHKISVARKDAMREVGQCKATISSAPRRGHQCRKPNLPGSDYCNQHQDAA